MNSLLQHIATPVNRRRGVQLALLAFAMTASPLIATVWLQVSSSVGGSYDYDTSHVVVGITWTLGYLGVVPLLFAIISLIARPVRPSWLVPIAVALALVQPIVHVLSIAQVVMMDIGTALLVIVVTGCSVGVLAVGLRSLENPAQIGTAVLTAVGVSIVTAAAITVLTAAFVSLTIAILLIVEILRHRKADRRHDVPATESAT